ncbi:MAG: hypothetical protein HY720_25965 [Planctomycetes bacterium]|nr:hypothetical protein [Planctomycetota bacterium]
MRTGHIYRVTARLRVRRTYPLAHFQAYPRKGGPVSVRAPLTLRVLKAAPTGSRNIQAIALVNTGYEADRPELIVPVGLAARLGWWPTLPRDADEQVYSGLGGAFSVWRIEDALEVRVICPDRQTVETTTDAVVSHAEREVLISDALASALSIEILDPRGGIWRLSDDPAGQRRAGEARQVW